MKIGANDQGLNNFLDAEIQNNNKYLFAIIEIVVVCLQVFSSAVYFTIITIKNS